jgi:hypothetical protein
MVEIHYCPKCTKASREHLFRKVKCRTCDVPYEKIDIERSRYFIIQFIFLVLGFIFMVSAFIVADPRERAYEFLGVSIIGITMWIFTLGFQIADSKDMEFRAEQGIMRKKLEEDEGKPFSRRDSMMDKPPAAEKDEEEDKTEKRSLFGKKKEDDEPSPKVVRIRRAVGKDSGQVPQAGRREPERRPAPDKQPLKRAGMPPPAKIRDMSALLDDDEDD